MENAVVKVDWMKFGTLISLAGLLLGGFVASVGQAQTSQRLLYDCDMVQKKQNDPWVSNKIGIVLLNNKEAVVSDRMILGYGLGTMTVPVQRNDDREIRVAWKLDGGMRESKEGMFILPNAEYTAVISKPANSIVVRVKMPGYRKSFSGRGQCATRTE